METVTKFEAQPKQKEFIEAVFSGKYNTLIYGGAMRGGKSYVCCAILLMLCKMYPGSKWVIVRESRPSLERTIIPTFNKICPSTPTFSYKFNHSKLIAFFSNGSQIHFMEESIERDPNLNRFLGVECNGFFFEQIEEISEKLFELSYIRSMPGSWVIPGDKQPPQLIMASCNPTEEWLKTRIWDKFMEDKLPHNIYCLPAKIADNEVMMASGKVDEIFANLDPLSVRMFRDGDWDAFKYEKTFMYSFDSKIHVGRSMPLYGDEPLTLSFDFNVEPLTCLVAQCAAEFIWVHEEIQIDHKGKDMVREVCAYIAKKYPGRLYIVTGDASGRKREVQSNLNHYEAIQKYLNLTDEQMMVRKKNIGLKDSRSLCNSILSNYPVRIHESCKTLIRECKSGMFKNGQLIKNRTDKKMDSLDAFRYLLDYALPDFLEFLQPETNFGYAQD